ncbi:class I SAM-dependent methyltransferase [Streptomyces sp. BR123]|uniref:class I SAM-dependent methyltransferase n=1 Tax=Streptomyces sp. BR123 TaxID=2749828 RepID=UPI0015C4DE29|nr:class I SAM-dependent methyltransferase [Streptomyces sp. BR123]NXY98465.1 class I SAM-dependent methyltransferase [Streptomyces sp. BR123]
MPEHAHTPTHAHDHSHHGGNPTEPHAGDQAFWDSRYRESDRIWSGSPNAALVREVAGLAPGRALDLGCGEGADAVWLARQGWQVTGTDISEVALERAAAHAAEAGVADRVDLRRHDLTESFPAGEFDLVSACFLHNYGDFPRARVLRTAAAAVAPGGILLVVGHGGWATWQEDEVRPEIDFPTPGEVLDQLELPDGAWEVLRAEEYVREQNSPDGRAGTRADNTVKVRRLP